MHGLQVVIYLHGSFITIVASQKTWKLKNRFLNAVDFLAFYFLLIR